MANYFDEHDCLPLGENERPNELILLARFLLDTGIANAMNMGFEEADFKLPPPVSRAWIENELPDLCVNESDIKESQCPICLKNFKKECDNNVKTVVKLPCKHSFDRECLLKWLNRSSNCPLCRAELPTDDPEYEQFKLQKKREKIRELELAVLHDSMYS